VKGLDPMTERLSRSVIEPVNPKLNVSRNANLPHSLGIRVGDYIFLSGMGPVDPEVSDDAPFGARGHQNRG
jgi:enamine deaminase RidA (YjgF/YER057c/UK114 family)